MSQVKALLTILLGLLLLSCSSNDNNMGYWIDDKPLRGTNQYKKDYKRPYWQCTNTNNTLKCAP